MSTSEKSRGGDVFCGLLICVFIALKLSGAIGWPWLWVLAPLWLPLAFLIVLAALVGIFYLILKGCLE